MHGQDISSEGADNALSAVKDNVERERDARRRRDGADVVVDRVAVDDSPTGVGVADPAGVMQREGGLEPGQTWCHELRPSRETGKEVGLDETGRDAHISRQPFGVEPDGDVATQAFPPR